MASFTIPPEKLSWTPDGGSIKETSTRKAPQSSGIVGQADARHALKVALTSQSWNHNAYIRGPEASGRRALIHSLFDELKPKPRRSLDFCYVHNFSNPDRPRLIVLPGGQGRPFQHAMTRISLFVRDRLPAILKNDPIRSRREARKEAAEREIRHKVKPMEARLAEDGLALMRTQSGPTSRVSIYPLVMGKPVSPEEYRNLVTQGQAREEDRLKSLKTAEGWQNDVNRCANDINQIWQQAIQHIEQINATETARILGEMTGEVAKKFKANGLDIFLREIIDDIVEKRVDRDTSHLADPTLLYGVNVLTARPDRQSAPTVFANQPSIANLFGTIDPAWLSGGRAVSSFRGIRTGALLEADGGFLVLDAADVLAERGCWRLLMRALRTGLSEVIAPDLGWPYSAQSLKPEPIPIDVRVVLIGNDETFKALSREDREFSELFQMLVDFDRSLPRDQDGLDYYVRFLGSLVRHEELPHFDKSAMLAITSYGARKSPEPGRLTASFGEIGDLAREAAALATEDENGDVSDAHVERAIEQRKARHDAPMRRLLRAFDQGISMLRLQGRSEGIVSGIAAQQLGKVVTALPAAVTAGALAGHDLRITGNGKQATSRYGVALARIVKLEVQPGILSAFQVFLPDGLEDVEHDSALDLARMTALIGALASASLRQDVALIGQLGLHGQVLPVDHINERVEAWFEVCRHAGLTGQQAIVIPRANRSALMLSSELIKACTNDMFRVYAVDHAVQAAELCTGVRAGTFKDGVFSEDSLLGRVREGLKV
ncbi:MAG: AAA family ATPase [Pseudomonadota bacterium]